MSNLRLAGRYAKSLIDLAVERNELETIHEDAVFLQKVCKASPEFVLMLRSPIIRSDKKQGVVSAITDGRTSEMTRSFISLLIRKNREASLPEIIHALVEQYNEIKGIHIVKLTTAEGVSEELKQAIIHKIQQETPLQKIELQTSTQPALIGGFVLEFDNNLVDASIARDLRDIKKQFSENIYVPQLR